MKPVFPSLLAASAALGLAACAASDSPKAAKAPYSLDFARQTATRQSAALDDQTVRYRAYEGIVYVKNPADAKYETLNIYVPEA